MLGDDCGSLVCRSERPGAWGWPGNESRVDLAPPGCRPEWEGGGCCCCCFIRRAWASWRCCCWMLLIVRATWDDSTVEIIAFGYCSSVTPGICNKPNSAFNSALFMKIYYKLMWMKKRKHKNQIGTLTCCSCCRMGPETFRCACNICCWICKRWYICVSGVNMFNIQVIEYRQTIIIIR